METTIAGLHAERRGSGPPLLLIHGIGHRWQMWLPVIDDLARDFEVVAVDLPGFGQSPGWTPERPAGLDNATAWLARALDELGWDRPHIAGNSLGGWLALELAVRGRAASVTGLAPAGLWADRRAVDRRLRFWFSLWVGGARRSSPAMKRLLRFRLVRTLALARLFGRPWRVPGDIAVGDAENLATCAFDEVFAAEEGSSFTGGRDLAIPVTIAWGTRDPLFSARRSTMVQLPPHTDVVTLPGCGHVPTWDAPERVAALVRATAAEAPVSPTVGGEQGGGEQSGARDQGGDGDSVRAAPRTLPA